MEKVVCPNCGEEENFHFNYDYAMGSGYVSGLMLGKSKWL